MAALTQSRYTAARLRYCRGFSGTATTEFHRTVQASGARGVLLVWRGVGILHRVCHFLPNITWETEMSTEALMEFVRELPNLYGKSTADNNDDIKRTKHGAGSILCIHFLLRFFLQQRNICVTKVQSYCNYVRKCSYSNRTECDRNDDDCN
jgi:hypothetical protein